MRCRDIHHQTYHAFMIALALSPLLGAAGYSLLYMLGGGGLGVAILIFIVMKMFGR